MGPKDDVQGDAVGEVMVLLCVCCLVGGIAKCNQRKDELKGFRRNTRIVLSTIHSCASLLLFLHPFGVISCRDATYTDRQKHAA